MPPDAAMTSLNAHFLIRKMGKEAYENQNTQPNRKLIFKGLEHPLSEIIKKKKKSLRISVYLSLQTLHFNFLHFLPAKISSLDLKWNKRFSFRDSEMTVEVKIFFS